ncbi:MAG: transcriptional regulator [Pedobacter sp.]|nr:MAG: transcriptional regulator [Pedobacter sp.]
MSEGLRESDTQRVAELLKVLAHPIRLKIINSLSQHRELNATSVQKQIAISQSLASHHLIKMSEKGILTKVRGGKEIYYSLADPILTDWLTFLLKIQR